MRCIIKDKRCDTRKFNPIEIWDCGILHNHVEFYEGDTSIAHFLPFL